ncbi:RAA5C-like protein [Mya arenaria]|uniref:RAA5C-like protein n=1 Tax=Mya arenaria TaxID=6604 RepID=A0ABY7G2L7_MYAAR|nr:RAA5C-like protein [Mya arenaria]
MPLTDTDCVATYKILVLGDATVGKTALLGRLVGKEFQERLRPTYATDFVRQKDTAGQERFRSVTRWQYHGVKGVAMVYDVTDQATFAHMSYWIQSVNEEIAHKHNKYETIPIVLLGNKCDLHDKRQVLASEGRKLAKKEMAFDFMETSAFTGENVFTVFRKLAYHVTDICNPSLMKSYYPNMIREPKFTSVYLKPNQSTLPANEQTLKCKHRGKRGRKKNDAVVRADMTKMQVTFHWTRYGETPPPSDNKKKRFQQLFKCCIRPHED